ncbi:MAG: serine/threonine-protein kinase [Vicinamibacterales bacterium]
MASGRDVDFIVDDDTIAALGRIAEAGETPGELLEASGMSLEELSAILPALPAESAKILRQTFFVDTAESRDEHHLPAVETAPLSLHGPADEESVPPVGPLTQLSHFLVLGRIGTDALWDVYEARDLRLHRTVALNVLKLSARETQTTLRRIQRNVRHVASLNHPNISTILDVGEADGVAFIATERPHGASLKERLREGPLSFPELIDFSIDVTRALASGHLADVVHGDIEPSNVFLTSDGHTKLMDFGLLRAASAEGVGAPDKTASDQIGLQGTIYYRSPEQLLLGKVDQRSDLWALGAVMYEAATGERPFGGRNRSEVIQHILMGSPVPPRELLPDLPAALENVMLRLLNREPERRYQLATELLQDLESVRGEARQKTRKAGRESATAVKSTLASLGDSIGDDDTIVRILHDISEGRWDIVTAANLRAAEIDAASAHAHSRVADCYNALGLLSLVRPGAAFTHAEGAAERALDIEPELATAHSSLGLVKFGRDWDWTAAERHFRQALDVAPRLASARVFYSWLLATLGRNRAAVEESTIALEYSNAPIIIAAAALTNILVHRYEQALDLCNQSISASPNAALVLCLRGLCYAITEGYESALPDFERAADAGRRSPLYLSMLGTGYGHSGRHDQALEIVGQLEDIKRQHYVAPQFFVYVYRSIGAEERSLSYQEDAYRDGGQPMNYLLPVVAGFYSLNPLQQDRLRQMGLKLS